MLWRAMSTSRLGKKSQPGSTRVVWEIVAIDNNPVRACKIAKAEESIDNRSKEILGTVYLERNDSAPGNTPSELQGRWNTALDPKIYNLFRK